MSWKIVEEDSATNNVDQKSVAPQSQAPSEIRSLSLLDRFSDKRASGFVNRFINQEPMERIIAGASAGPMAVAAGQANMEDALPSVIGVAGGVLGGMLGHPNVGAGAGYGIGDVGKQLLDKAKGETDNVNVQSSFLKGAGAGLASKGVESILKIGGQSLNLIPEVKRVAYYDQVKKAADLGYKKLVSNYGKAVNRIVAENPSQRVALNETVSKISSALEGVVDDAGQPILPQIARAVKNNPRLKDVINNPEKAIGLTLKEANDLKSAISSTVKPLIKRVQKGGTATPQERGIFEILSSFDKTITKAFPQMREVNEIYRTGKDAYNLARPMLEPGKPIENAIMSSPQGLFGLGGSKFMGSTGGKLALKEITSKTRVGEKLYNSALLSHNLNRAADAIGRWAEIGAGAVIAKETWGKFNEKDGSN